MNNATLQKFRTERATIKEDWIAFLRAEPVSTPLGHPEALRHLIDETLDQVFADLVEGEKARAGLPRPAYGAVFHECVCGRNPLLAYFLTGERALFHALLRVHAEIAGGYPQGHDTDLAELYMVFRRIARREMGDFCALCHQRGNSCSRESVVADHDYRREVAECLTP